MASRETPSLQSLSSIKRDGSRNHIHPADVRGRFLRWRTAVYAVLIGIYVSLPFVKVGGNPAVFLDVAGRRFFLFGATFNSQDFWLVIFLLAGIGFSLFFVTAWLGRVWCGWACPQTVFLEGVYRRIERWSEGPREKRIRLATAPWTAGKVGRKVAKHFLFVLVSLFLSHVLLSFFVSLGSLVEIVRHDPRENWVAFLWTMLVAGALYFNFAWFREQLCIVICPYGRLQSALQDEHSLIIGYDERRGEPRGKIRREDRHALPVVSGREAFTTAREPEASNRKRALSREARAEGSAPRSAGAIPSQALSGDPLPPPAPAAKGDCVDCNRCVVVCPTGIDIRNGLQLECIGCAQCIDACDEVMLKVGRPVGLIRYDSHNGLTGLPKRTLRPRLLLYGGFLLVACVGLAFGIGGRTPFEANLLRARGAPFVIGADSIRNQFELHVVNKNPVASELKVRVKGPEVARFTVPRESLALESLQDYRLPIFVEVPRSEFKGPFEIEVGVKDGTSGKTKTIEGKFLGPIAGHGHAAEPRKKR